MKNAKKVGVEAAGWKVGSAEEFLSLSDADRAGGIQSIARREDGSWRSVGLTRPPRSDASRHRHQRRGHRIGVHDRCPRHRKGAKVGMTRLGLSRYAATRYELLQVNGINTASDLPSVFATHDFTK